MTKGTQPLLTREDIAAIAEKLTADDLIEGSVADKANGIEMLRVAFNRAAAREGYENATQLIRASDFKYFAQQMAEVVNVDSPLPEGTES